MVVKTRKNISYEDPIKFLHQEKIAEWNEYRHKNPSWIPNLIEINLNDKDLAGVNLDNSKLQYSSFEFSNLQYASFKNSNLFCASFQYSILIGTVFSNTKILQTKFYERKCSIQKPFFIRQILKKIKSFSPQNIKQQYIYIDFEFDYSYEILFNSPSYLVQSIILDFETMINYYCYLNNFPYKFEFQMISLIGGSLRAKILMRILETIAINRPKNNEEGIWAIITAACIELDRYNKIQTTIARAQADSIKNKCIQSNICKIRLHDDEHDLNIII